MTESIPPDRADESALVRAIDAVLQGTATVAEQQAVAEWRAQSKANDVLLATLPGLMAEAQQSAEERHGTLRAHIAWRELERKMHDTARPTLPYRSWRWAAAAAVVLVLGTYWQRARTALQVIEAPLGQRVTTTLPDGSQLTLAAGSRASWPRTFRKDGRDVHVDGEAYFDVVHDDQVPFRVHVRHAIAEDIGTRFVVRGWSELDGVDVAVEEGEVALADSSTTRTQPVAGRQRLLAGDRGRLSASGVVTVTHDADAALGWLSGDLHFSDTPLREALPVIGRWYDVTIAADTALLDRRLSAHFAKQPLPQLLDMLTTVLGVRATRSGSVITLIP